MEQNLIKSVAIFGSVHKNGFVKAMKELLSAVRHHGVEVQFEEKVYNYLINEGVLSENSGKVFQSKGAWTADLAFSLGGDGTFLKTACAVGNKHIPILGINLGNLGFMVDVCGNEIREAVDTVFYEGYQTDARSVLKVENITGDQPQCLGFALNEAAILKLDMSSMIKVHTVVNGEYLCTYRADGLIVATPTGSTGYSLSVGSSILAPQNQSFILSPVAPHSLNIRPVVVPDTWVIDMEVESRNRQFLVSLDGRSMMLSQGCRLRITKADYEILVARRRGHTYFNTLREKLMWGVDVRQQ